MKNYKELADHFILMRRKKFGSSMNAYTKSFLRQFASYLESSDSLVKEDIKSNIQFNIGNTTGARRVALITEEIGSMTGGRYYAWFIGIALVKLGFDVTIYTNQVPTYIDYFKDYRIPKLEIITPKENLKYLDIQADIYISSPLLGNVAVTRLSEKYKKPCYVMVFDPIPMMVKYTSPYTGWEESVIRISQTDVNLLTLCESTKEFTYEWLNKKKEQVTHVYPCVNSVELDKVPTSDRENYVVFISRLIQHKKFEDVLNAVKESNINLKVISSVPGSRQIEMVKKAKMQNMVDFYIAIDDEEKFKIINKSMAVISASNFEGFGMWAAEAVATGTPLVSYDLPTIVEIKEYTKLDNIYLAKFQDKNDLSDKLKQALKEKKIYPRNRIFDFESMVERLRNLFMVKPKIGVVTIALNEEQYIGASLKSVIKNEFIKKVAVIEGAVELFGNCNEHGLSIDKTKEEILKLSSNENGAKITYEEYGFAKDKSELRNRALSMLTDMDYILVVDADEVWRTEDLNKLVIGIQSHPEAGVYRFRFNHFWKKPNLVARGSNWESRLFRCFNFSDKTLHWADHEKTVIDKDGKHIEDVRAAVDLDDVYVSHYGYMKSDKNVQDKIEYYRKRDKNLTVVDTFTNWKPGMPTSTTHGGGAVDEYTGKHPLEVADIIKL